MKTHKAVLADGSTYQISLKKLIGKKIVDVQGYISQEFGDSLFSISNIILEDGTSLGVGGEHDIAYIESELPNNTEEDLDRLYEEANE